jgi:DNA invertase Pin-like site-specific DNA recombinase
MSTTAYIRVSTDSQDVQNQRHELETYATAHGLVIDRWIEADGVSSRKGYAERQIDTVLRLRKGDVLLVTEFSRLARSVRQVLDIVETLGDRGVLTHIAKLNLKINGKNDIATTAIISSMALAAQIERELISSRTREALARRRAEGKALGMNNKTPDQVAAFQAKAAAAVSAKAAARADGLKDVLAGMVSSGIPQRAMAEKLNFLGIPAPRGGHWSQATLSRMVKRINALDAD